MQYEPIDRAFMLLTYAEFNYDYPKFRNEMRRIDGPKARVPDKKSIDAWKKHFLNTGTVENKPKNRRKTARTKVKVEAAREAVNENPNISIRDLSRRLELSQRTAHMILREDLALYPYKAQTVQTLLSGDLRKRQEFALRMMRERLERPATEVDLFFVDEAHFHTDGVPNKQNFRTWAEENPQVVVEIPLHPDKVTAIMGIGVNGVVGPFFFNGTVNGEHYREVLTEHVIPALRQWPNFANLIFVQDGAPAHWAKDTRALLDLHFPNRWIGRSAGFIEWPARSPDLSPLDFFVWGYLKDRLYRGNRFQNTAVLKEAIIREAQTITGEMARSTIANFWKRILLCEFASGGQVEIRD
jgi:DDE superfamily endonuclease